MFFFLKWVFVWKAWFSLHSWEKYLSGIRSMIQFSRMATICHNLEILFSFCKSLLFPCQTFSFYRNTDGGFKVQVTALLSILLSSYFSYSVFHWEPGSSAVLFFVFPFFLISFRRYSFSKWSAVIHIVAYHNPVGGMVHLWQGLLFSFFFWYEEWKETMWQVAPLLTYLQLINSWKCGL